MSTQVMPQQTPAEPAVPPAGSGRTVALDRSVRDIIESARSSPATWRGAAGCSLATAGMLWASFTPLDFGWLAWVALVPLIQLIRIARPTRAMYGLVYVAGLAWSLTTLQWMRLGDPSMYPAWIALAVYMAMYFPAFVAVSRIAVHRFSLPLTLAVPLVWTGLEYLRATLMTGFAWYFLAHTQYAWTELIQVSDLVGAYGVSFLVGLGAACIAGLVPLRWLERLKLFPPVQVPADFAHLPSEGMVVDNSSRAEFRRPWRHVAVTLGVIGLALVYGAVRRSQADFRDGPRVALIQGNFPASLKHDTSEYRTILRYHEALTGMAVKYQPDLIVWPETMFRWPLRQVQPGVDEARLLSFAPPADDVQRFRWVDEWASREVPDMLRHMSEMSGASMVIGLDTWIAAPSGITAYNSAAFVTPDRGMIDRYDKIHRVVFGEYLPLKKELPFLAAFSPFGSDYGITAGTSAKLFRHGDWNLSPVICFEDTVPHLVRRIAREAELADRPVDVFVNLTNDGWFIYKEREAGAAGSSELDQHLITASFRSVETRTPMVRAVNTGVSAFIDGDGVIRDPEVFLNASAEHEKDLLSTFRDPETGRWRKSINAALVSNVPLDSRTSLYVRGGDWFAGTCCGSVIFFGISPLWRRRHAA